jgi:site-specific DNA-methyltransferase (adenine-specific)
MACAIEDAGFEVRDQIMWIYGSGFPKSLNVGKMVDKIQGNVREVVGEHRSGIGSSFGDGQWESGTETVQDTKGHSEWEGFGTALKPAHEPICMARKPLSEDNTAENVLKWRTGGINIDGCRIGYASEEDKDNAKFGAGGGFNKFMKIGEEMKQSEVIYRDRLASEMGRFPANLIHDGSDEVLAEFAKYGESKSTVGERQPSNSLTPNSRTSFNFKALPGRVSGHNDSGTPARFFYCAKASKSERDMNLGEMDDRDGNISARPAGMQMNGQSCLPKKNIHPTVKPIDLMKYLIKLVTPAGGIVLDPFTGSGSTLIAAKYSGYNYIGIELSEEYCEIARRRLSQQTLF